jgi:copper chaperone CopZ
MSLFAMQANAQITKAELVATGLTCSMCSNAINKQFKSMPEVESVTTDLNSNTFTINLKKGNTVTPKAFKDKVEKAGFFIGSLVLTMPFDNIKAADNIAYNNNNISYIFLDTKTQTLQGDVKVKVLDKGFVTQKEYKRLTKSYSKYPSYAVNTDRNFHLKILQR